MADRFCSSCGRPADVCTGCARPLDPPHFCGACGTRLAVRVAPTGWRATCRTHGAVGHTA